jgi:hypothetical protein
MTIVNYQTILRLLALSSLAVVLALPAHAATLALDITGGANSACPATGPGCNLGWGFHVNSTVVVSGLGLWDDGANGLAQSHNVGLWTLSSTLLTSATVTNAATPVASTEPTGQWLFVSIAPVVLAPGDYVIGAFYASGSSDFLGANETATTLPEITFSVARGQFGASSLAFPASSFPGNNAGYFGPNLELAPEPAALSLVGSSLVAFWALRKRRKGLFSER